MRKRILIGIYIILLIVCFEMVFNCVYNAVILQNYNKGKYTVSVEPLKVFNWNQPYIAYYNKGNIEYRKESYWDAIEEYNKALEKRPPKETEERHI